jgi:two-component system, LuxR family, response regulator FixJ
VRDETIYVIDDDDAVRDSLRVLLECEGYKVVDFASCADFLRNARPDGPSCLVLDVHIPGMSGLELLEQLRHDNTMIAVVIISGRLNPVMRRAVDRAGVKLLEKPFATGDLVASIEAALRGGRLH